MVSDNCPDNFKGTQLLAITALNPIDGFDFIYQTFKNYPKTMFFIDEISSFFKKDPGTAFSQPHELLKIANCFPNMIAATTKKEYSNIVQYLKSDVNEAGKIDLDAFERRFEVIEITPLDDRQIGFSLNQHLQRNAAHIITEKGIIPYIIEKTKNLQSSTSRIDAAHSLLKAALKAVQVVSFEEKAQILNLENQAKDLEIHVLQGRFEYASQFIDIQEQINKSRNALKEKEEKLARIKKYEASLSNIKKESFATAAKTSLAFSNVKPWLSLQAMKLVFESSIIAQKTDLSLQPMLSKALIDSIVSREKRI
jgi:hypothetical protein